MTFHLDHLGPLPSTSKNYKHVLAIIDAFSKFVWIFPTKSLSAEETKMKLQIVTSIFGNPERVITDQGSAFTGRDFTDFCKDEQIELIHVTTGVPRGNGQIERIHQLIISILAKLTIDEPGAWFKHVNKLQLFLNNSYQRAIGTTPGEIMFGVPIRTTDDFHLKELIEKEALDSFMNDREQLRMNARDDIASIQQSNKKDFDLRRKEARKYNVGDIVAIKRTQFGSGLKLRPKFWGPYEVTKVQPNDRYQVKKNGIHEGSHITSSSADFMKPWPKNGYPMFNVGMIRSLTKMPSMNETIVIEGTIAAGKTTLVECLAQDENIEVYPEPLSNWHSLNGLNLVEALYQNPTKWWFPFQSYAILTMTQRHLRVTEKPIKIMERSLFASENCFVEVALRHGMIARPEYDILKEWFHFIQRHHPLHISSIIYLRIPPELSYSRIQLRKRPGEDNITIDYLKTLVELYDD